MNKLLIMISLLITGCSTVVPVSYKFPEAPTSLMEPEPQLTPLDPTKRELSDLLNNVNENYGKYHELVIKYKNWQEWYKNQKEILDKVNKN